MSRTATPADVLSGAARWCVVEGDATDVVRGLPLACVDALCEGRRVILVEQEPRFAEIARQRCEHATPDLGVPVRVAPTVAASDLPLFGGPR